MNTRETLKINNLGHIEIGKVDVKDLVDNFKTPLYVFDRAYFESVAKIMRDTLNDVYGDGEIAYASKAFAVKAVYRILSNLGLSADVVSGGELYLALSSGFDAKNIYFHGNAKTQEEIEYAVSSGVGTIVIESADEVQKISRFAKTLNKRQGIMIRVNPCVEAHTHDFVLTGTTDSKFGIQLDDEYLFELIRDISRDDNLKFSGLHIHIGSQIFDYKPYIIALKKVVKYIKMLENDGIIVEKLNVGGGFGIKYTDDDPDFSESVYKTFIENIASALLKLIKEENISKPKLIFEPGRSLVGEAGITLYKVNAIKDIKGVRKYVSVDGGMFDNPRFALYGAKYEAVVATRADEKKDDFVTISGKCCESGDIITKDVYMQKTQIGDIIAVMSTGAYNYSMASNYNANAIPPVVMVYNGNAEYIVKPQTYEDLARNNIIPESLK